MRLGSPPWGLGEYVTEGGSDFWVAKVTSQQPGLESATSGTGNAKSKMTFGPKKPTARGISGPLHFSSVRPAHTWSSAWILLTFTGPHGGSAGKITDSRTHRSAFYSERASLGRLFLRKPNLPEPSLPTEPMRKPVSDSWGCCEDENRQFIRQICVDPLMVSVGTEKAFDKIPCTFKFEQTNHLVL